jgi:23S rRNA pseudouridine1911/1915/1917 synthase
VDWGLPAGPGLRVHKPPVGVERRKKYLRTVLDTAQFERREVAKEYLALVHGVPDPAEGVVEARIQRRDDAWPRMRVHEEGQRARTGYEVEEAFPDAALVRFRPETGRTHQIRLHAAFVGHPLLCDVAYGGRGPVLDPATGDAVLSRTALHSARLALRHPGTDLRVAFEAPLPADMRCALEALRAAPGP